VDRSFQEFLVQSLTQAFSFGLSAAMPAIAALLAASLVLGMAQRNFPQLGGMQVGLNAQAICGMLVTSCLLLTAPWIVNGGLQVTLDQLQSFLAGAAGG
jgi:flagellar biosynthesis protein FliR